MRRGAQWRVALRNFSNEVPVTIDVQPKADAAAKTQSFEADVSRLLHLMVHSV